ncbi:hypothetical protein CCH79_00003769 [Gambusia affinis]|uniref:Uncharacterized protein n=1 Tax=Gambusia affinis TaxID=33528 RepID=A0A315VEB4_GAMAF|nr:hypothetical protein CCH79_00003769 [Gambusia affinis]
METKRTNDDDEQSQENGDDAQQASQSTQPPGPVHIPVLKTVSGLEHTKEKNSEQNRIGILGLMEDCALQSQSEQKRAQRCEDTETGDTLVSHLYDCDVKLRYKLPVEPFLVVKKSPTHHNRVHQCDNADGPNGAEAGQDDQDEVILGLGGLRHGGVPGGGAAQAGPGRGEGGGGGQLPDGARPNVDAVAVLIGLQGLVPGRVG